MTRMQEIETPQGMLHVGDTVTVDCYGEIRTGVVNEVHEEIKNGVPGFGYKAIGAKWGHWSYLEQIVSIDKKAV